MNGRFPIMWQIELVDQVTWCSAAMRTSPAQKNAVSAPHQDQVIRPPSRTGMVRLRIDHPTFCCSPGGCQDRRAGRGRNGRYWSCPLKEPTEVGVPEAPGHRYR